MNNIYGNQSAWLPLFQQVFAAWAAETGNTYVYQATDDGASFPFTAGALGARGDVRIGGHLIDGNSGILAYNFFPNTGDMVIDTADSFYSNTSNNSLRLRNTLSHEHGHGLGLSHVCPIQQTKLMEPFLTTAFDGPQIDDRLGGGRGYGDENEHNDMAGSATNLGTLGTGTTTRTRLSIDDSAATDIDFFRFNTSGGTARVTMRPVGSTYLEGPQNSNGSCTAGSSYNALTLVDLGVQLIGSNGSTVLATANSNGAGQNETTAEVNLPNGTGPYYVRVFGNGSVADVQLYELDIVIGAAAPSGGTLTVTRGGSGTGTISSSPSGISCGNGCQETYNSGTTVTLTATPDSGSSLVAFTGAADCTDGSVTVTANLTCKAIFTRQFTDDPLTAQTTEVKAAHIAELRSAVNTLRGRVGLGAFSYADPTITAGTTVVRRVHLIELRTSLDAVYDAVSAARPTYTDTTVTVGATAIRAVHVTELRNAVRAIDSTT